MTHLGVSQLRTNPITQPPAEPGKPSALHGSRIQCAIRSTTCRQRVVQLLSQASLSFENNDLAVVANWQEANRKRGV